jgi:hypothetical protein
MDWDFLESGCLLHEGTVNERFGFTAAAKAPKTHTRDQDAWALQMSTSGFYHPGNTGGPDPARRPDRSPGTCRPLSILVAAAAASTACTARPDPLPRPRGRVVLRRGGVPRRDVLRAQRQLL